MKQDKDYPLPEPGELTVRQAVELEILSETDIGFKALVDDKFIGLIYRNEISQPLEIGQYLKGWIKTLREDGKIDLSITQLDDKSRDELENKILQYLRSKGGSAPINDKTPPEQIYKLFSTSKKNFKRALGGLYKNRLIVIGDTETSLTEKVPAVKSPWGAAALGKNKKKFQTGSE